MPHSVIDRFNVQDRNIYVNTHYQHFEKTVKELKFKQLTQQAFIGVYDNISAGIKKRKSEIDDREKHFLMIMYPNKASTVIARQTYRKDIRAKMAGFSLGTNYLNYRDTAGTFSISDATSSKFNYVKKELLARSKGDSSTESEVQKYIKDKLSVLQGFFLELSNFLDSIYDVLNQLGTDNPNNYNMPTLLNTMRKKARKVSSSADKIVIHRSTDKKMKIVLQMIRDIEQGKIEKLGDLGNNFHSKMFNAINESMYEYIGAAVAAALLIKGQKASAALVNDMIKSGGLEFTGQAGQQAGNQEELATTDFIIKLGTINVGYDVKANRETYTHNYGGKKHNIVKILSNALGDGLQYGAIPAGTKVDQKSYLNIFAYSFVNMLAMDAINRGGIDVPNSEKVNQAKMYEDLFVPIQRIILVSAVAQFLDNYLGTFSNNKRDQIIILLGDNIIFLSEFLKEIEKMIFTLISTGKYDSLGYVEISDIRSEIKKVTKKTSLMSLVEDLSNQKTDWILKKKSTLFINAGGAGTSGTGSWYPLIFSDAGIKSKMRDIAEAALGKNIRIRLAFNFQRLTKPGSGSGGSGGSGGI